MAQTLLIKEFVELARALGSASPGVKDRFSEYLKSKGFANLNEYKSQEEDEELAVRNFKQWLAVIDDGDTDGGGSMEFEWGGGSPPAEAKTAVPSIPKRRTSPEVKLPVEERLPEEEPTTISDVVQQAEADTNANEVLRIVKEGFAGLANVAQPNATHGKAIDKLVSKHADLDNLVNKCWDQLKSHMTDEVQHGGGGSFSSFDINILPADKKWEGEQPLHYKFPLVAAAVTNRIPTMIVGPAGWGKTSTIKALATICEDAWDDNSVDYRIQSIGPQTSKSDILGYMDANGNYVKSVFYECFSKGMLYACDEADAGSAGSLTLLNQGFANQECHFPGQEGMTERHGNFVPLFLANTFGLGANATYVGRNQLDAATIDRFAVVEYDYDEHWEGRICGISDMDGATLKLDAGGSRTDREWVEWVGRIRNAIDSLAIRHVVSPRASINGIKLLKSGLGFTHVSNMCVWKGMDSATRTKIINETNI